ncbi:hypothetical protein D9613_005456 [Agrocybe pediades]|uniref:Uncharacterized protein n=1 Tax=Agrocybe pediades TaxID=84607 RepID=A0A8H4QZT9_9AGAR|nr:hypothetical protein D9613_005456 [Agrocybe pediades]
MYPQPLLPIPKPKQNEPFTPTNRDQMDYSSQVPTQSQLNTLPPKAVKKIEKEIMHEGKHEEKQMKTVIKDLSHTEKEEHKMQKQAAKAESKLEKLEKKEQAAKKDLLKAEHKHDLAIADLHKAQKDFETTTSKLGNVKEAVKAKSTKADEVAMANEQHTLERNAKINALHGPSAANGAGRVIADPANPIN